MADRHAVFDPGDAAQRDERLHHFSHALKNRLGSLWQAAALLYDLPQGPERKQLLELAERSYFTGAQELEKLMDDFGVPRGLSKLKRSEVHVASLLEQCITNSSFRTTKKKQEVLLQCPEGLVVHGDTDILRQLFEALLSNASKFSPPGSTIAVEAVSEDGQVCIRVDDQGNGLTEEDLQQIFQRYAILSSRSTDGESQARSTLARVKQWVELHGGTIAASSSGAAHGSCFVVRLPVT